MGNADRIVRLLVAGVFAWLYFTGIISGIPGILLLVVGGIFVSDQLVWYLSLVFNAWNKYLLL